MDNGVEMERIMEWEWSGQWRGDGEDNGVGMESIMEWGWWQSVHTRRKRERVWDADDRIPIAKGRREKANGGRLKAEG